MRRFFHQNANRLGWMLAGLGLALSCPTSASAAPETRRALAQANRQVAVERHAMDQLRRITQAAQTAKTEWTAAQDQLVAAQRELEQVRRAALRNLQEDPAYRKQVRDCREAEEQLDALRQQPDASRQQILDAARQLLSVRGQLRRIEAAACEAEPRIKELQQTMADATATLRRLREEQQEALRTSPAWQAAKQRLASVQQSARNAASAVERAENEEWEAARRRAQSILAAMTRN